ncbi:zinc knuckle CX2CX4HX4C containing protein [Tanacetum coccineum]
MEDKDDRGEMNKEQGLDNPPNDNLGVWFKAELEKCWKIQQGIYMSNVEVRRQAQEDALRNWEDQVTQIRIQDRKINECKVICTSDKILEHDIKSHSQKEDDIPEGMSCLPHPKKLIPGSFSLPCSINNLNFYAMADLGASVSIMSKSLLKKLKLAELKGTNILVEMADMTKCTPLGIIENVTVKIDQFSFLSDFVIIDTKATSNETIILGRHFLATIHAKTDVFAKEVSLGVKDIRVKFKMNERDCDFTTPIKEIYMVKSLPNDNLDNEAASHEFDHLLGIETDIFSYSTNLQGSSEVANKEWVVDKTMGTSPIGKIKDWEDPERCGETKSEAIIGGIVKKLPQEWFIGSSRDKDNLEGIIYYLEPKSHDGFIDPDDEVYKQRRCELLGMPYKEPPPILKEKAEITRYSIGAGEVYTKGDILDVNTLPRTMYNIADIRAELINERNMESEDLSTTKKRHWCEPISQWKEGICINWASCNPYSDDCDGGDNSSIDK